MDIKEKNTTMYKLREEINNLESKLRESEKQVKTYKDVANTFETENKKLEDKLKRTKERHMKIIEEFENQIDNLKLKSNSEKRILEKTNRMIVDKAKALDEVLIMEGSENRKLKDALKKLENKIEELENKNWDLKEEIERSKVKNKGGRKKRFNDQEIEEIKIKSNEGKSIRELGKMFHCSIGTIHNIIKEK